MEQRKLGGAEGGGWSRGRGLVCFGEPVVSRNDDVDSSAGLADVLALLVVHLPQRVGEGSGGVDHTLRFHIKLASCERV